MNDHPVITALAQEAECYRRLAKLAQVQHEHIQQCRTDDLLEVLAHRQGVLNEIALLERTIAPVRAQWTPFLQSLDHAQRNSAELMLGQIRALLEQITSADFNDTMVLQQRKINLGRQIGAATAARQVNRSYAAAAYSRTGSRMDMQR